MADFEPPSFSLGLDCDESEHQITSLTHNHSSIPAAILNKDDDFETLIVDDSEPEYPDPHPKRLRRLLTAKAEFRSTAVVDDEDVDVFSSPEDCRTDEQICIQHPAVCTTSKLSPDIQNRNGIDSNTDDPSVSDCANDNGSKSYPNKSQSGSDLLQHVGLIKQRKVIESIDASKTENLWEDFRSMKHDSNVVDLDFELDLDESLPPAYRYFFHIDSRIQELVRICLPNFTPLGNRYLDHYPCTSTIDYMGQFSHGESSDRKNKDKKSSSGRKTSKRSKIEEESQGWVNPKLDVDKRLTKGATKRKAHTAVRKTAGHWLTDLDGMKVYVSKKGQELNGRVAYMQYRKESGAGFKRAKKRKSATK